MLTKTQKEKIKNISILALDVDGVMTSGKIVYDHRGREIKVFNVRDGLGLVMLHRAGLRTAIISAKKSFAVTARARELGIAKVYQNAYPKDKAYRRLRRALGVRDAQVCFVGDDLTDLAVFNHVGFCVAVKNATPELKAQADYVTRTPGGEGAVREVAELVLKSQGKWQRLLGHYGARR